LSNEVADLSEAVAGLSDSVAGVGKSVQGLGDSLRSDIQDLQTGQTAVLSAVLALGRR
jgi:uncharacterized protein YoxC